IEVWLRNQMNGCEACELVCYVRGVGRNPRSGDRLQRRWSVLSGVGVFVVRACVGNQHNRALSTVTPADRVRITRISKCTKRVLGDVQAVTAIRACFVRNVIKKLIVVVGERQRSALL